MLLLCANANVEVEDHLGRSPLWIACHEGQLDVARKLLGAKASVTGKATKCSKIFLFLKVHLTQFGSKNCLKTLSSSKLSTFFGEQLRDSNGFRVSLEVLYLGGRVDWPT